MTKSRWGDRERERGVILPFRNRIPDRTYEVEPIDTGGVFRPDWRKQDPTADPREPFGGESSGAGTDHGWSNCTMTAAALGYAYEAGKQSGPWGGDMRHNQDDLSGGTDLYDAKVAWDRYGGHTLTIKNGQGWDDVEEAHAEGRAILIQGEGNVPGSESFDGGHACIIGPETRSSDGYWLFGDPLASGWQWCSSKQIREWAQALDYDIMFAVGKAREEDMPGVQVQLTAPYTGKAAVRGDGHYWIRLWDGHWGEAGDGFTKEVVAKGVLVVPVTSPGGTVLPAGTEVVVIGADIAILLEKDVELMPSDDTAFVEAGTLYIRKS